MMLGHITVTNIKIYKLSGFPVALLEVVYFIHILHNGTLNTLNALHINALTHLYFSLITILIVRTFLRFLFVVRIVTLF